MNAFKKCFLLVCLCVGVTFFANAQAVIRSPKMKMPVVQKYPGTNLRGRVFNAYNKSPLTSVQIDLLYFDAYNRAQLIGTTYTDGAGYYYFKNVIPNDYVVRINQNKTMKVQVSVIDYNATSFQDIPSYFYYR